MIKDILSETGDWKLENDYFLGQKPEEDSGG